MKHKILDSNCRDEVMSLFRSVFTASEGEKEGRLIGDLAAKLSSRIDHQEIICVGTDDEGSIIGAAFFTRLRCNEGIQVYMLAPVAVDTNHQGKGVGQALIHFGLDELKRRSVTVVVTYGDPSFYTRTGFRPLSENVIQAPLKLSIPEGWLGLSLLEEPIPTINERPTCVQEFNDPAYW